MKPTCGIFTNIAPLYSRSLWYELSSSKNVEYSFFSSRNGFSGIKTIDINESKYVTSSGKLNWHFLRNIFIKDLLVFQTGIISKCLNTDYDAYILYGEMHSISNWIAALICKIRNKPVMYWGHGLYGNEKDIKKWFRVLYYKLADYHLVYAERSRKLMIESGFSPEKVFTVFNSLDFSTLNNLYKTRNSSELDKLRKKIFPKKSELPVVIFIGRLIKEKKISYLLEAVAICKQKGNEYNCLIVGGGIDLENLKNLSDSLDLGDTVCFYGPSYDENINARFIMLSECCVSPGNVGLTAIHSLSLGTPVITHSNMYNQGPEADAVIQGETGMYFHEDNINDLSDVVDNLILNRRKMSMEANCIAQVKEFWNPAKQTAVFDEVVLKAIKD